MESNEECKFSSLFDLLNQLHDSKGTQGLASTSPELNEFKPFECQMLIHSADANQTESDHSKFFCV